jgi:hypothetical protein
MFIMGKHIRIMNLLWVAIFATCLLLPKWVFANHALTDGGVDSIIDITVQSENKLGVDVPDLREYNTPVGGSIIAHVLIENNDLDGFGITLESERFGKLQYWDGGAYASPILPGHSISYLVNIEQGSGTWGTDFPQTSEVNGILLSPSKEIFFDDNVVQATHAGELIIKMELTKNPDLFHGTYRDVITYTLRDL